MSHTRVFGAGHGVWTTAEDYAHLGQLLLNRGGYGDKQFFSETTFVKMLPGEDAGMGVRATSRSVLGDDAFGHDGSNSSFICISPKHELVMTVVSGGTYKGFSEACVGAVLKIVLDQIADDQRSSK
jgi:CubicO group peptidase (beta-lactamase class C family)